MVIVKFKELSEAVEVIWNLCLSPHLSKVRFESQISCDLPKSVQLPSDKARAGTQASQCPDLQGSEPSVSQLLPDALHISNISQKLSVPTQLCSDLERKMS